MIKITIKENIYRTLIAAVGSLFVFLLFPAIQLILKDDTTTDAARINRTQVVMQVKHEKPKPKKEPPKQLRKIQTRSNPLRSQTTQFKFAPDLGVEGDQAVTMNNDNVDAKVFDESETDEQPVAVATPGVTYPMKARTLGVEGVVEIVFIIDTKGHVIKIDFAKLPHELFRLPVENTVRNWRFKPARMKGVPVSSRARRNINFRLGK